MQKRPKISLATNRFFVNENDRGGYDVTDTTTATTQVIYYNYIGNSQTAATTWDFAPLDEQREVDGQGYLQFRNRMHGNDEEFIARQMLWNRRLDQFHAVKEGQFLDRGGLTCNTWVGTDTWTTSGTANSFWLTSDVGRFHHGIPWMARHCPRLVKVTDEVIKPIKKLSNWLHLNESEEEITKRRKEKNGMKLLKSWLDEHEFNELMKRGELEIFAEDVVYIVKKSPNATVLKKEKDGTKTQFCLIPKEMGYATGDILLAKILMLKTDPKNFEKQSHGHVLRS